MSDRAAAIEKARVHVELLQRDLQIAQAQLRLLEIDNETHTVTETLEKLRGLRADVGEQFRALGGEEN